MRDGELPFAKKTEFAKTLRQTRTPAEQALWKALRSREVEFRFTQQHPIGTRFADFACRKAKVVVELDGDFHLNREEEDRKRDEEIASFGYLVLRFSNTQVLEDGDLVVQEIIKVCESRPQWRY